MCKIIDPLSLIDTKVLTEKERKKIDKTKKNYTRNV